MKKIILTICMFFVLSFSFSSCIVGEYATTQDDVYYAESYSEVVRSNVDINIVISRGTPYYYNGSILYYIYNGLYYYPYYYDNYWYMRVYRRPFDHVRYRPYFRPNRYDYRFNRDFHHPREWRPAPPRGNDRFGNVRSHRPEVRPDQPNRQVQPDRRPQVIPNQQRPVQPVQNRPTPQATPQATPQRGTIQSNRAGRFGGRR